MILPWEDARVEQAQLHQIPATMHEAGEKSPLEKGSELPGFSLEPISGSKMQFPQELPAGSY